MRLILSAIMAFGSAAPAAAQVHAKVPGSVSVVPAFTPSLAPAPAPDLWAQPLSLAPIPTLAASVIPSAAVSLRPSVVAPALARPGSAPATDSAASFKDLGRLVGTADAASAVFDGAGAKDALENSAPDDLPLPLGAKSVSVIRLDSVREASAFIPAAPHTKHFIKELAAQWRKIGWLDLRVYTDGRGGRFHAVDLSGRPNLAEHLPGVQPHEAALIRKIQLRSTDLQLVILEAGKTPDLIVDGVVTEMKSPHPTDKFLTSLADANEQVLAHAARHLLGPGAAAIELTSRDVVPVAELLAVINDYVRTDAAIGLASVSVYAGKDRRVFVRRSDGLFDLRGASRRLTSGARTTAPPAKSAARFPVPDALGRDAVPDPEVVAREVSEPAKRLRAAGVKATVTMYGSARILSPEIARAELDALIHRYGKKPKRPEDRKHVEAGREAVEMSKYYKIAREFGRIVAEKGGGEVAVVSGGGPGIMEAANRGAFEAGGPSVGYNIILDKEQGLNRYATPGLDFEFKYFATRKMALRLGSMGLVYFPGGFGTMDELFEVLTLMQTRKMPRVPIVLIGEKAYWDKILDFSVFERMGLISSGDRSLFRFADTAEGAWREVSAPPTTAPARFLVPDALGLAALPDLKVIAREVTEPIRRLRAAGVKATVTVYGSARIRSAAVARTEFDALIEKYGSDPSRPEERKLLYAARQAVAVSRYYEIAREFGRIVAENGGGEVAVVSGGGPGIMEAANRGAFEAGGPSVGYNIILDKEQGLNRYATPGLDFKFEHFATRKMALRQGSMGLVYFPGGFGTMDELFEVLTLMQTRKMPRVPIVLIGEKAYWEKILDFEKFSRMGLISPGDLSLFRFADTAEAAWRQVVAPTLH